MSTIIDKISGSRVTFDVVVSKEKFEEGLTKAFEKKVQEVEVKGFRKGHCPRDVYEKKFGVESLYDEALNIVISDTYYEVVEANNIDVCAYPKIDFDPSKIKRGEDFTYNVKVAVKPVVELGKYLGVEVKKASDLVTDDEVEARINDNLRRNAMLVLKDEQVIENGDTAIFDFEGFADGVAFEGGKAENYELVIGSGQFIPGFEEQMIGMKANETKDINVTFPENYQAENLKGKDARFVVTVHEVKSQELPELNDEFVKEQNIDGVETVNDYRKHLYDEILASKKERNENSMIDELFKNIVANAKYELPEELVNDEAKRFEENTTKQAKQYGLELETYLMYTGTNLEKFREDLKEEAKKSLGFQFVVQEIANKENIVVSKEELESKYAELAKQYNVSIEQAKAGLPEYVVADEVKFRKAIDLVKAQAKVINE